MMALGVSPFIMQITESLISVVFNTGLQRYGGDMHVGAMTILQSVMQLKVVPLSGFTQGVQPIISYNYGAKQYQRVRLAIKRMAMVTIPASFVISLLAMLLPTVFASLFTDDAALIALVGQTLPIYMAGMLIFGVQNCAQATFVALGQAPGFAVYRAAAQGDSAGAAGADSAGRYRERHGHLLGGAHRRRGFGADRGHAAAGVQQKAASGINPASRAGACGAAFRQPGLRRFRQRPIRK